MEMVISFPGNLRVDAQFGHHVVHTDQPHDGDEGSAPTPFATFLASIGTCAGIYVLGFCRQRGLDAEGIRIVERVTPGPGGVARIDLEIHVPQGFPPKYHAALVRSAEQCAVKKQLEAPPRFDITVVEGDEAASPRTP